MILSGKSIFARIIKYRRVCAKRAQMGGDHADYHSGLWKCGRNPDRAVE